MRLALARHNALVRQDRGPTIIDLVFTTRHFFVNSNLSTCSQV